MSISSGGGAGQSQGEFLEGLLKEQDMQTQQKASQQMQRKQQEDIKKQGKTATQLETTSEKIATEDIQVKQTLSTALQNQFGKPSLQGEEVINFSAQFQNLSGDKGVNLIAIMAAVLLLQSKSSSDFWKTMWNEASSQMNQSIQMAPVIANAVRANWDEQAHISEQEAHMALAEGVVNIVAFGASVGLGAYMGQAESAAAKGAEEGGAAATDDAVKAETDAQQAAAQQAAAGGADTTATTAQEAAQTVEQAADQGEQGAFSGLKKAWAALKQAYGDANPIMKSFMKGMEAAQFMGMMANGVTGMTNYTGKMKVADSQRKVGEWQSVQEQLQITVQYYQQAFGRTDSIMQGQQQQVDRANQTLTDIASTISNAISQGFSKI